MPQNGCDRRRQIVTIHRPAPLMTKMCCHSKSLSLHKAGYSQTRFETDVYELLTTIVPEDSMLFYWITTLQDARTTALLGKDVLIRLRMSLMQTYMADFESLNWYSLFLGEGRSSLLWIVSYLLVYINVFPFIKVIKKRCRGSGKQSAIAQFWWIESNTVIGCIFL